MEGECSTHGRDEKCIQFLSENVRGRDQYVDLGKDGKIILEQILGI
jgi:hypothetical protein